MTASEMTPADIRACTCGNENGGGGSSAWGGDWSAWIIIFLIFAAFGFGGNGGGLFGGSRGGTGGVAENYVLASDFATIQRQLSDGISSLERKGDTINAGLCDGFYAVNTAFGNLNTTLCQQFAGVTNAITQNGYESRLATQNLGSQLASCCCDVREGISGVNYNMATQANGLQRQIADSSCDISRQLERGFAETNYNMATQNCATMAAIDKVGDRIIDYMSQEKMQTLRDENQALRLAASQQAQNAYLVSQLGQKCPEPAYIVQPPQQVTFPTNCCGTVNYASGGCGCNG